METNTDDQIIKISRDVYSSGQVESKLWLCRQVEKLLYSQKAQTIWVLGGWVGLLSFLLLSRERLEIKSIRSFDTDFLLEKLADIINGNWVWKDWQFKAKTADCNNLNYKDKSFSDSDEPDLIINTSVEHFKSDEWYKNIPYGKTVVLQSCDLKHKDHINCVHSEEELKKQFEFTKLHYSGKLTFDYKTHSFSRYMLIVEK